MRTLALLVCRLNIIKFRKQLAAPVDETQRKLLVGLLAEEEIKEEAEMQRTPAVPPRQSDAP